MLSKSKFIRGEKCRRSLWLYVHRYDLLALSDAQQAIMNRGTQVGVMTNVLGGAGISLSDEIVMHQNIRYVRIGSLDLRELFT